MILPAMFDISASVPPFLLAAVGFPPRHSAGQRLHLIAAGLRIDLSANLYKGFRLTHSPELVRSCHTDPLHISHQHRSDAGQVNEPFYTANSSGDEHGIPKREKAIPLPDCLFIGGQHMLPPR